MSINDNNTELQQLILRIAEKDNGAFEELYGFYYPKLYWIALGYVRDHFAAEEAVQETFLRVWQNASAYRPSGSASSWLYSITRNLCIDERRRSSSRERHEVTGLDRLIAQHSATQRKEDSPADYLLVREQYETIIEIVSTLPIGQQQAVYYMCQGYSMEEISERLEIPVGTVKSRLSRARKRIRKLASGYQDLFDYIL